MNNISMMLHTDHQVMSELAPLSTWQSLRCLELGNQELLVIVAGGLIHTGCCITLCRAYRLLTMCAVCDRYHQFNTEA